MTKKITIVDDMKRNRSTQQPDAMVLGRIVQRLATTLGRKEAAQQLQQPETTLKNWIAKGRVPARQHKVILSRLGFSSAAVAELSLAAAGNPSVKVLSDFAQDSEEVFLALFKDVKLIRETRIMMWGYPSFPPRMQYRTRLNSMIYKRMTDKTDKLRIEKVEQIDSFDRAIDLGHNISAFEPARYDVCTVATTPWIPYINFSIFDDRAVIAGGFHGKNFPSGYPFAVYVGTEFVRYYERLWAEIRSTAIPLSMRASPLDRLVEHLSKLNSVRDPADFDNRCNGLTVDHFERIVEERAKVVAEHPTRY